LILELLIVLSDKDKIELLPSEWRALAACESSLNPEAISPSGKYKGLFQFDDRSWGYVGGSGDPSRASVREQYKRAKMLKEKQGWNAWPVCSKQIGVSK
jgi:resuscitation-promoting factor RpfB